MKTVLDVPRVTVPGADPAQVEHVQALVAEARDREEHLAAQKAGLVLALIRTGRKPGQKTAPDARSRRSRKARKAHR